jgi:PKD repeat protein
VRFRDRSSGAILSWLWDFGDGASSTEQSPTHVYTQPGNYTVKLTVTDANNDSRTETKNNFVRTVVFEKNIDNVDYPKTHYGSKTILFRKELEVPKEEMRYSRLLYTGCDSGHYYPGSFNRGVFFYAVNTTGEGDVAMSEYLKAYVNGASDWQLWRLMQDIEPLYDYYDFRKPPSQQW